MWSDTYRYTLKQSFISPVVFPNPNDYTDLDLFLVDTTKAIEDEKQFRTLYNLNTSSDRYNYNIERLYTDNLTF